MSPAKKFVTLGILILLALALGCGLVASIGISQVMDRKAQGPGQAGPETEAIAALEHSDETASSARVPLVGLAEERRDLVVDFGVDLGCDHGAKLSENENDWESARTRAGRTVGQWA